MQNYSSTYTRHCNFFIILFLFLFYFFQLVFHATFVIVYTFSEVVFSNLLFTIFCSLLSTILFTHTHTQTHTDRHTHKSTLNMGCYGPTDHRPSHITRFLQPPTGFILSSRRKFVPSKSLFLTHKHHSIVSFI